jgi:hypothetical protein
MVFFLSDGFHYSRLFHPDQHQKCKLKFTPVCPLFAEDQQQFIAPQILMVAGKPAPCECTDNIVCAYCVQANLLLWEREEGKSIKAKGSAVTALREAIKKKGLRTVARELGVDHKSITHWIKKKNVPEKYVLDGVLMGKEAISEGYYSHP